jgi:FMN phosphatase YigB (HAD superfamily)
MSAVALGFTIFPSMRFIKDNFNAQATQLGLVSSKPAVIFDFNGVLFHMSKKKIVSHLGFFDTTCYALGGNKTDNLRNKVLTIFNQTTHQSHSTTPTDLIPLENGNPLPTALCKWMRGSLSTNTLQEEITPLMDKLYREGFFESEREYRLVKQTMKLILDPAIRAELYAPIKKGVTLARLCKKHGYRVYLLSNMDSELIPLVAKRYPAIFDLFDGKIISADVHLLKPEKEIYAHLINTYNLSPERCYFIDDQVENIRGAQSMGINGILCNHRKYNDVYDQLRAFNLLPHKKESVKTV